MKGCFLMLMGHVAGTDVAVQASVLLIGGWVDQMFYIFIDMI